MCGVLAFVEMTTLRVCFVLREVLSSVNCWQVTSAYFSSCCNAVKQYDQYLQYVSINSCEKNDCVLVSLWTNLLNEIVNHNHYIDIFHRPWF